MGVTDITPLSALTGLRELHLTWVVHIHSLEPLRDLTQLTQLAIDVTEVTSLQPLSNLCGLLDLNLRECRDLPYSGLGPLSLCTALKVLDITCMENCDRESAFDLGPLASCRDLRRLYIDEGDTLDLTPLQGLPKLVIKRGRDEFLDAREL